MSLSLLESEHKDFSLVKLENNLTRKITLIEASVAETIEIRKFIKKTEKLSLPL